MERAAVVGLSDSEVIESWSASYNDYNCYGYAIRTYETRTPGNYSGANPGGYSISMTASILADYTIKDLEVKGYNAYKTTTRPTIMAGNQNIICVRTGSGDYHFMRATTPTSWTHKPGFTSLLRWKYSSPGYKVWTNERYDRGQFR